MITVSTTNMDPLLTGLLANFMQQPSGLVGLAVAPLTLVPEQSAKYYVLDPANAQDIPKNLKRAPSTEYKRSGIQLSDDSYYTEDSGIVVPIDDTERGKLGGITDVDRIAMQRAATIMRQNHEWEVHDAVQAASQTAAVGATKYWNDYTNPSSNPIVDVETATEAIRTVSGGLLVNTMVLPRSVWLTLKNSPFIQGKMGENNTRIVTVQLLQELFGIPNILIPGVVENSAADGQTASPSLVWSEDNVWVGHVEPGSDITAPNAFRSFSWTGQTGPDGVAADMYRDNAKRTDNFRATRFMGVKQTGSTLGYLLTDVLG